MKLEEKNEHITGYLEQYINRNNSEFSVLLTGKWGVGKTFYIKNFIKKTEKDNNFKFIEISLFGLKETVSIDEQIFEQVNPFLKQLKTTTKLIKASFKVDLTLFVKFWKSLDHVDKTRMIFVFDDLERTEINFKEVLGYINRLIEHFHFKVIIIANEENLLKSKEDIYKEFKEKVVGKTFDIEYDFKSAIMFFIESLDEDKVKNILKTHKDTIEDIHKKSTYHNLRYMKQAILDFESFIRGEYIDSRYLNSEKFLEYFIFSFFVFSIEVKHNLWNVKDFSEKDKDDFLEKKYASKQVAYDSNLKKFNLTKFLFSKQLWQPIIFSNFLNQKEKKDFNSELKELPFFIDLLPSFRQLRYWYLLKFEEEKIRELIDDVVKKFNSLEYEKLRDLKLVIALLVDLEKIGLSYLTISDIEIKVKKYIEKYKVDKYKTRDEWYQESSSYALFLGDYNADDEDVKRLHKLIYTEISKKFQLTQTEMIEDFLKNIQQEFDTMRHGGHHRNSYIPEGLTVEHLINILEDANHQTISNIQENILNLYPSDTRICNFINELSFWKKLAQALDQYISSITHDKKLHILLIKDFREMINNHIIKRFEGCQKGIN